MIADAIPKVYPPRSCSDAWGWPKVGYPTRRAALRVRRLGHKDQHPYYCPRCTAYHLGHRP